jgi:hypothetical protein
LLLVAGVVAREVALETEAPVVVALVDIEQELHHLTQLSLIQ